MRKWSLRVLHAMHRRVKEVTLTALRPSAAKTRGWRNEDGG
jgi:hypothetical protein